MEVILRDDVDKLGRRGDIVKVADGYGRNFLLPRGLAMAVNDANKAMIEKERKANLARLAKEKAEFEALAARIAACASSPRARWARTTCSTARSPPATSPSS